MEHLTSMLEAIRSGKDIDHLNDLVDKHDQRPKNKTKTLKKKKDAPYTLKEYMRDRVLNTEFDEDTMNGERREKMQCEGCS